MTLFVLHSNVVAHVGVLNAQHCALHSAEVLEVVHYLGHNRCGNRETITAERTRLRIKHSVDTHQFATRIDKGATRITGIDGSIGLDETFNTIRRPECACLGRDNTCRHGVGQTKGIANSKHPFAKLYIVRVCHGNGGESLFFHLNQGKVGRFVQTDNARLKFAVVVELYGQFISICHDMVIGYDITIFGKDDPRTSPRALGRLNLALTLLGSTVTKELAEEIFKRIVVRNCLHLRIGGYLNIYYGVHRLFGSIS